MTVSHPEKQKSRTSIRDLIVIIALPTVIILTLFSSGEIRSQIIYGIRLAAFCVVPSIFPFLIISDFIISTETDPQGCAPKAFERTFKISRIAFPAFASGSVCGFPVGIKIASDLYKRGCISKNECERLIGFSSNPSIAFVISGIGIGAYNNAKYGLILYISITVASIITGFLLREESGISVNLQYKFKQTFNLADSVKTAGLSCISISSYIIFFSAIIGMMSKFIKNDTCLTLLTTLLEITSASKGLSLLDGVPIDLKLSLTAFALSFSGLCIAMQTRSILPAQISMKKYCTMKISSAAISFLITYLLMSIT